MPRPMKDGLSYFPFDTDFFSDNKIRILKARYGANGIVIYLYLLCEIYKNGYYLKWNEDLKYILTDEWNLTDGFIEQVLKFLLERSLLSSTLFKSDTILTSPGIQRRYQLAVRDRARKRAPEIKGFWLLEESETEPFMKVHPKEDKSGKNESNSGNNEDKSGKNALKERKEKKKKEYKTSCGEKQNSFDSPRYELALIDGSFYSVSEEETEKYQSLYPLVDVHQEFRKMIGWLDSNPKNRKTQAGIRRFMNGWLSRSQDTASTAASAPRKAEEKKNRFKNFDERENNYEEFIWDQIQKRSEGRENDGREAGNAGARGTPQGS